MPMMITNTKLALAKEDPTILTPEEVIVLVKEVIRSRQHIRKLVDELVDRTKERKTYEFEE